MADDLASQIAVSRDRITKLLTGDSAGYSLGDIGTAAFRAAAGHAYGRTPSPTFGDALNAIKAQRISKEGTLLEVLTSERAAQQESKKISQADRRLDLEESRLLWDKIEAVNEGENADRDAVVDAIKMFTEKPQDRARLFARANELPQNIDRFNAYEQLGRLAEEMYETGELSKADKAKPPEIRDFKEGDELITRQWNEAEGAWEEIGRAPRWEGEVGIKVPTVREFTEGDEVVERQWNPDTGKWDELSRGPRYKEGMELEIGPEGQLKAFRTGAALETSTRGALEKKVLTARDGLDRIAEIETNFRPDFLQIGTKFDIWLSRLHEKAQDVQVLDEFFTLMRGELTPEDQQAIFDYSTFYANSVANINQTIRDITGAQMSVQEAKRIRKQAPDPGDGVLTGNSPSEFVAKLQTVKRQLALIVARAAYARNFGLKDPLSIPLDSMPGIMRRRESEVRSAVLQARPDLQDDDEALREIVRDMLAEEFDL